MLNPAQTLWLLASNPTAQVKLREEVVPLLANHPQPDYRTLTNDMPYLDAVMWGFFALHWACLSYNSRQPRELACSATCPYDFPKSWKGWIHWRCFCAKRNAFLHSCKRPQFSTPLICRYNPRSESSIHGRIFGEMMPKSELPIVSTINIFSQYTGSFLSDGSKGTISQIPLRSFTDHIIALGKRWQLLKWKPWSRKLRELCRLVSLIRFHSHLAANFSFEPAYDGQMIQPTAAVTMSYCRIIILPRTSC